MSKENVGQKEADKPDYAIVSNFTNALSQGKEFDHGLEGLIGDFIGKKGKDVAMDVVTRLYEPNGKGVPKFIEALAPYLHINLEKLTKEDIDKYVSKYGILMDTLRRTISGRDVFDTGAVQQITTQLAANLVNEFTDYIPASIANQAYKNMNLAKSYTVEIGRALGGDPVAKNLEAQLRSVHTPEQLQATVNGILSDAYTRYKGATPNTIN